MARRKPDPGAIYVSPRLQASLEPMGPLRPDHGDGPYGLRKDHGGKLVFGGPSRRARPSASAFIPTVCLPCGKADGGPFGPPD